MRRLVKKGLLPTNKASGRSRANVAKAASIAPLVSALRIRISHPRARAADYGAFLNLPDQYRQAAGYGSTSRNIVSVFVVSAGLTITATRAPSGRRPWGNHRRRRSMAGGGVQPAPRSASSASG